MGALVAQLDPVDGGARCPPRPPTRATAGHPGAAAWPAAAPGSIARSRARPSGRRAARPRRDRRPATRPARRDRTTPVRRPACRGPAAAAARWPTVTSRRPRARRSRSPAARPPSRRRGEPGPTRPRDHDRKDSDPDRGQQNSSESVHTALITSAASLPPKASDVETPQRTGTSRGDVGDDVDLALGVGRVVVDRRRDHAALDGQRQDRGLDRAGGAEAMADHRLDRVDRHPARPIAEDDVQAARLGAIVLRRGGAVAVDVIDLVDETPRSRGRGRSCRRRRGPPARARSRDRPRRTARSRPARRRSWRRAPWPGPCPRAPASPRPRRCSSRRAPCRTACTAPDPSAAAR